MKLSRESLEKNSTILGGVVILISLVASYTTLNNHVNTLREEKSEREKKIEKIKITLDRKIIEFDEKIKELTILQYLLDKKYKNKKWFVKIKATNLFSEGKEYYKKGRYDLTILTLEKALKDLPNNTQILLYLAQAYRKNNNLIRASGYIDKAIDLGDISINILNEKGVLLGLLGDQDKAILYFKKIIVLNKLHQNSMFYLSYNYRIKKEYDLALEYANNYIDIYPGSSNGYRLRGEVYSHLKDYDKAIKEFNKAIEFNGKQKNQVKQLLKMVKIKKRLE